MPFIYRGSPANIDRSAKRGNDFIDEVARRALIELSSSIEDPIRRRNLEFYCGPETPPINLLPTRHTDPRLKDADPNSFFVLYALKRGLSWFEVEHWLDILISSDMGHIHLEKSMLGLYIDGRRRYYQKYGIPRGLIWYLPE